MDFITLLLIFVVLELFESTWQKSDSLHGLILNNFYLFKKNIFIYILLHTSFFYTIYLSFSLNNFGFWMSSILVLKFLDIIFKLSMLKKLNEGISINDVMPMNVKMTPLYRYMNVIIYPLSYIFAVSLL